MCGGKWGRWGGGGEGGGYCRDLKVHPSSVLTEEEEEEEEISLIGPASLQAWRRINATQFSWGAELKIIYTSRTRSIEGGT